MTDRSRGAVIAGAVLMSLGVMLLGGQLGWWHTRDLHAWWPLFPITFGLGQIMAGRNGYMLVAIGGIFLLDTVGHVPFRQTWPTLLVVWGVSMLFRPARRDRRLRHD
jgi:hypothetical protein